MSRLSGGGLIQEVPFPENRMAWPALQLVFYLEGYSH